MLTRTRSFLALAALACAIPAACTSGSTTTASSDRAAATDTIPVTVTSASGKHVFDVEVAATPEAQQRGLMFRTDIEPDGGMLFAPYPPNGGAPREANFWMKNTPSPLDIIFIRPDHTITRIAENTVPYSETGIPSGAPVAAVLEIKGGRAAALGIAEDDKVSWPGQ